MKNAIILLFILGFTFSNCKKSVPTESAPQPDLTQNVSNINQMIVPNNFIYDNSKKANIKVFIDNNTYFNQLQLIEIYDGNPFGSGNLICSGSANMNKPFERLISYKRSIDLLYIIKRNPDNSSSMVTVSAKSAEIMVGGLGKGNLGKSTPSSPDCNTGCTSTVTGNSNINLNNSADVVCITGSFAGDVTINRGTVRICGNATIGNCNLNNDAVLLIASTASVTIGNINLNGSSLLRNWSISTTVTSSFSPGGSVDNYGTLYVNGGMNINGSSVVNNEGVLSVSGTLNNNKTLINSGTINVGSDYNQNGGAALTNACKMIISGNMSLNNPISNNGYIKVTQNTTINSGGILNMAGSSMFTTNNITINNIIIGTGATSLVKVSNNTIINGGGRINGTIQFCDASGIETNTGIIAPGVSLLCDLYIPKTVCNNEGNGTISIPDTDADGVADNLDEYPSDPDLAFNNFYPNEKETATAAFEDLWPSKGDYDLNDLVVDFKHNFITNANNEIVKYEGYYRLRASGGNQQIGFCMGLPVDPEMIDKLEGASLENGHKNVVLQIFDNSKKELGGWNTVMVQPKVEYKEYKVSFIINKGPSIKEFGAVSYFDPFIWINEASKGRGYEIHIPGNAPTALADAKLFGYADDDTNVEKAKYYLTKNNLPWGIVIPETFDYCVELSLLGMKENPDITQAYLHFAQWAQSGGEIYSDWYKDEKGYRNKEYFYTK
ncbi:MAG: LruC domain-containing protein [bacterium]|nr:LruC domain-containing protein [bacterium]